MSKIAQTMGFEVDFRLSSTCAVGFHADDLPYLYQGDVASSFSAIAVAGYEAVELFVASPDSLSAELLETSLYSNGLALSAIGTGGAARVHRLYLGSPDKRRRAGAEEYVCSIIDLAGRFGAATILGSIIGGGDEGSREGLLARILPALDRLAGYAARRGSRLVLEPLNRYESSLLNRLDQGIDIIMRLGAGRATLLADCFHMNIEETSIAASIRGAAGFIGHVHLSDSNRRAPGYGHIDYDPIFDALRDIGYKGFLSVEVLPLPNADSAALQGNSFFKRYCLPSAVKLNQ